MHVYYSCKSLHTQPTAEILSSLEGLAPNMIHYGKEPIFGHQCFDPESAFPKKRIFRELKPGRPNAASSHGSKPRLVFSGSMKQLGCNHPWKRKGLTSFPVLPIHFGKKTLSTSPISHRKRLYGRQQ